MPSALDDIADELYALRPEEFTATRNSRAGEASDRSLASEIRALKKPSVAAWAVNRLVRASPAELRQVLALADDLREAQQDLDAAAMSKLNRDRRALTTALARRAAEVCAEDRAVLSSAVLDDVAKTLNAAMMDAAAADAVMTARLVRPLEVVGFGGVDLDGAVAGTVAARGVVTAGAPGAASALNKDELAHRRALKAAQRTAREAAQAAAEADRERARATAKLEKARDRQGRLHERRDELAAELKRVADEADAAGLEVRAATKERDETAARAAERTDAADRAQAAVRAAEAATP